MDLSCDEFSLEVVFLFTCQQLSIGRHGQDRFCSVDGDAGRVGRVLVPSIHCAIHDYTVCLRCCHLDSSAVEDERNEQGVRSI